MTALGCAFGLLFGKMVFGGFGRNVFNPAMVGRAFLYVSFGAHMTSRWTLPLGGFPAGLSRFASDAITQATPGMTLKTGAAIPLSDLLVGGASGVMGGTSALLTMACGLYLLRTKAANYRIVVSGILAYLAAQGAAWFAGVPDAANPLSAMLSGGFMFGIFFFATDPVSASQTQEGRWIYGALIGALSSVISVFSSWPAGTMFAILLANMFAPLMDIGISAMKAQGKGAP
jgi:Na+-transporting NADH:ubiquinone oxidoreductase subunit B